MGLEIRPPGRIAKDLLNSDSYLNPWEMQFLANIPRCLRRFGNLTKKQTQKLHSLASRGKVNTKANPQKNKPEITLLQFKDLCNIANTKLSESEQTIIRLQLRKQKKNQPLDKLKIHKLHRKYFLD